MSKTSSSKLFDLIKTLSLKEKRYLRKNAIGTGTMYETLFDAIDLQNEHNDKELVELIYPDGVKSRSYSELKAYLFKLLLKSLHTYENSKTADYRIKDLLLKVKVLYKRSHYAACLEYLDKVHTLARKYEDYMAILEILKWKKQIAYATEDIGYIDIALDEIEAEENDCMGLAEATANYENLFYKVLKVTKKNPLNRDKSKRVQELKIIIDDPLLAESKNIESFNIQVLTERIYSLYYYNTFDFVNYYLTSRKAIELLDSNPEYLKEDVTAYIAILSNLTQACGLLKKYKEVEECLEKFNKITPITLDNKIKLHQHYYMMKLYLHIDAGTFQQGLIELNKHLKESALFQNNFNRSQFYSCYIKIYFGVQDYDKALEYMNKWLSLPKSIARQDLQSLSRTLDLIIHYEMKNIFLLESLTRSVKRYQKGKDRLFKVEQYINAFIKNAINAKNKSETKALFQELKKNLEGISYKKEENIIFKYFDFISWAESKIKGIPFADVIQQKFLDSK